MSKVYVNGEYGFVGFNGSSVRLDEGAEYDLDDPVVQAHPDKFTAQSPAVEAPVKRRPGRPRKSDG